MARNSIVSLIDDISGEPADETVTFGLDGVDYEIDLTNAHARALRSDMVAWADAGRATRALSVLGRRVARVPTDQDERVAIRKWGGLHGYVFLSRGRIKYHIIDAYRRRPTNER